MDENLRKAIQTEIDCAQSDTKRGFYFWQLINIANGLFTIVVPALGALMSNDEHVVKICAGLGSVSAGIYVFLRPDKLASAYDWACQHVWKTDVAFNCQQIEGKDVSGRLAEAISATTFRYVSSAGPASSNAELPPAPSE